MFSDRGQACQIIHLNNMMGIIKERSGWSWTINPSCILQGGRVNCSIRRIIVGYDPKGEVTWIQHLHQ